MIDLQKVTTATREEYNRFYQSANDTAKALGVTTEEVISQTAEWARLGYAMQDAAKLAENSAIFEAISPDMDITQATDGLVSIIKAYDLDVEDSLDGIISKVNEVGNKFAVSNGDIVEAMTRSSAAMAAANNTFEETVALATAAIEITRDAATVGNGLKTLSMRIRGYDEETEEYSADVSELTGTIADLTKVASNNNRGISLFEADDPETYRSTYDILSDIADIWDELTDKNRANLLEALFGKRQAQIGAAILSNFDQARSAIVKMEESAGSAGREMDKITQSLDYKLNALKETWVGVAQNLFQTDGMKLVVDALNLVSNGIDQLTEKLGLFGTIGLVGAIALIYKFRAEMNMLQSTVLPVTEAIRASGVVMDGSATSVQYYATKLMELDKFQRAAAMSALGLTAEQKKQVMTMTNLIIPWVSNLNFELNYADVSRVEFDVPRHSDGKINPVYHLLTSYKMLFTEQLGIYILQRPATSGDGVSEVKHITGYSIEQLFEKKKLYLEEGTYNFWNPVQPEDTILGRILELDTTWSIGYVDPKLIGCYRTFDEYDSDALSFCYGSAMEKYNCTIVFDVYARTISAYDAGKSRGTVPIYLSYQNLVDAVDLEELTDDMVTKLHLYGSDDLSIRDVNPIGTDYMVNLSYFISNGDFDVIAEGSTVTLAERVKSWNAAIKSNQTHYTNLVAARASRTAQRLAEEATLASLKGDLEVLTTQQSVIIQAMALESTAAGKTSQQQQLTEINEKISAKNSEIEAQETVIANLQAEIDRYTTDIQGVVEQLSISKYFTKAEQKILNHYLIEGEAAEETFVATDVDTSASGAISTLQGEVTLTGADIAQASLNGKSMYAIAGGVLKIASAKLTADIVRGTLEVNPSTNEYVLTVYMGSTTFDEHSFPSGLVTASGILSQFSSDISPVSQDGVTENKGTQISFEAGTSKLFFTVNVNEYQKYSVAQELYAFGEELLDEWAWPVYEFSIDTANFLFQKEFEPFKNKLEFGKSIYLNVGDGGVIEPKLIGVALDFENPEKLTLTFSNRFQKRDVVANWLSEVNKVSASSRSFDTSKYLYNRTANKTTQVSQFMENALNAAVNTIIGASNQSVVINGAGIQVGGDSKYQLRIVDNMIAMTDDGWKTAKLGIGRFYSDAKTGLKDDKGNDILIGETWGINTELLAGSLIIGNNLVLENANDNGVMQFKVDATGAWLYNASYIMQHDDGGLMIFDPKYGIVAGNKLLFNTNGTTVTPEFIDDWGDIKFDADGMPENANFYLDLRDGSAYFRGRIKADSGSIGGWELAENELHCGSNSTFVALNSSKDTNSLYAIWAGATKPENAKFWVKRDGTLHARDGEFSGTLSASRLSGNLTADPQSGGWLKGCGIDVNNGAFYVDPSGNVTMKGSINMADGSITWGSGNSPCLVLYCSIAASPPTGSYNSYPSRGSTSWHKSINDGDLYASYTYDGGVTWTSAIKIRGEDGQNGKDGQDGMDGSDATVNERNVFNVLTNGGTKFGVFSDSSTRKLYINASYIRAGQIDADLITLGSEYGGFCCARGSDGVSFTYGAKMYGSDDEYYFIATNKGVRMQAPDHGFTITNNGLFADEEISVGSDRRLKQAIEYRMDKYENFFMKLKPAQYQLKAGKSKRLHTGFIAQDVERALLESGLTTNDFAGLTITPVQEVNPKDGIDDVFYRLRYGEFISLNTYMIQTLYLRGN